MKSTTMISTGQNFSTIKSASSNHVNNHINNNHINHNSMSHNNNINPNNHNINHFNHNNNNMNQMNSHTIHTVNTHTISNINNDISKLISPKQMLLRLLPYSNKQSIKQCHSQIIHPPILPSPPPITIISSPPLNKPLLLKQIHTLQSSLTNIHSQLIQSQNLLHVRNSLYFQLDSLREERQQIQQNIGEILQVEENNIQKVKTNNYKEMNQRLKRRMGEIKEYIQKMQDENRKIQECIHGNILDINYKYQHSNLNNNNYTHNPFIDSTYFSSSHTNIESLLTRLHLKQQQALQRVKRQQQEIQNRNNMARNLILSPSLSSNNLLNNRNNNLYDYNVNNMQSRTYYPSNSSYYSTNKRRYYSPEYKY